MPARKWTQQRVVEAIRERQSRGLPLTQVWSDDKSLYLAAHKRFGSWVAAMAVVGLETKPRQKWSKDRVLDELRAWHRQDYVNLRRCNRPLLSAVTKYFGNLRNAMAAADLESKRRKWPEQRVIEAIQDHYIRGLPLEHVGFGNIPLASAAWRRFGSWRKAWLAAGLPADALRLRTTHWTREEVLTAIRRRYEQGLSLTTVWREYPALSATAYRFFGGWHRALAAAGINVTGKQP